MRVRNGRDSLKAKHGCKTANDGCGSGRDGQEKNDRPERPLRMCVGRVLSTLEVDCSRHSVFLLTPVCNADIWWDSNLTNNTNFQSPEVVDRGSETQLQVTEN